MGGTARAFFVSAPETPVARPAPDISYLTSFKSQLESHYAPQDAQIDVMRDVRMLADPPVLPEELKVVDTVLQDPTVTDEIARVVATLSMRYPQCTVTPGDPATDAGQENSTLRESFTEEVLRVCGGRVPGHDTWIDLVDACVADGAAVAKLVHHSHRWEKVYQSALEDDDEDDDAAAKRRELAKKKAGPPFSFLPVDVRSWYPLWESDEITEVIEVGHRPTFPTLRQYGVRYSEQNGFDDRLGPSLSLEEAQQYPSTVEFCEHWDQEWVSYWVSHGKHSKLLKQFRHGYGRVPYFFAPGIMMNHWKGRKVGWGVGMSKLSLTRFRSYLLSLMLQATAREVGSPMFHERSEGATPLIGEDLTGPLATLPMPLAGVIEGGLGERLVPVPLPGVPESVKDMLGVVTSMVSQLDTPRVNANVGGDLAGAGFAIQSILAEGKTRHHPFIASLERLYEDVTYFLWDLIVNKIEEKVWVRRQIASGRPSNPGNQWLGAGPEDLDEAVGVKWTVDPEPATSKIVDERYVGERLQQGTMSLDQAIAYMGDNPDEVRLGKFIDRLRNEGFYVQYVNEQVLRELRRGDLLKQAQEAAAQSGILPGMDPLMAAQLLTQMAPGQATPLDWGVQGQVYQQMTGMGQPLAQPQGAAPGGPMMPDPGALAAAPGGGAAIPTGPPGGVPGAPVGQGFVMPQQAIQAGAQQIGG